MFKTFNDLAKFKLPVNANVPPKEHRIWRFKNWFWFSIVRWYWTYGFEKGLYELAVLKDWSLCYSSPLTDDVLWNLTEEDVIKYINLIAAFNS